VRRYYWLLEDCPLWSGFTRLVDWEPDCEPLWDPPCDPLRLPLLVLLPDWALREELLLVFVPLLALRPFFWTLLLELFEF
jgi:hypothetical protein